MTKIQNSKGDCFALLAMTFSIDSRLGGSSILIILVIAGYRGLRRPFGCAQGRLADDG